MKSVLGGLVVRHIKFRWEVDARRQLTLAMRWLLTASRNRSGRSMAEKLAAEFIDAANEQGAAVKKRDDTHRMAESNRAFAHFRF